MADSLTTTLMDPSMMKPAPGAPAIPPLSANDSSSLRAALGLGGGGVSAADKQQAATSYAKADAGEKQIAERQEKQSKELEGKIQESIEHFKSVTDGLTPPTIEKPGKPPAETKTDPWQTWGSPAMWVAVFGSMFTRQHATTALNAAAGVLNATNKGDADETARNMDIWKTENENTLKYAMFEQKAYEDAMNKGKDVLDATLTAFKNEAGAESLANGAWEQYYQDYTARTKSLLDSYVKADIAAQKKRAGEFDPNSPEYQKFKADPAMIKAANAYDESGGVLTPDLVKGIGGASGEKLSMLQHLAAELHPDSDWAKNALGYREQGREMSAFAVRSAAAKVAIHEIDNLATPMLDALSKLDTTNYPDLNSLELAYQSKTGGPEVKAAYVAVQEFKTALTNLMVRNGMTTDAARARSDEIMSMNFSLDQAQAVVDQAKISSGAVIDALHKAKKDIAGEESGSTPDGRISVISPDGIEGHIPEDQLDEALKAGYKRAE